MSKNGVVSQRNEGMLSDTGYVILPSFRVLSNDSWSMCKICFLLLHNAVSFRPWNWAPNSLTTKLGKSAQ